MLPTIVLTPFASFAPACCTRSDIDGLRAGVVDVLDGDWGVDGECVEEEG